MYELFSDQARRAVVQAEEEARVLRHPELDAAHLLLAAVAASDSDAAATLEAMGVAADAVRDRTRDALGAELPHEPHDQIPLTTRAQKALDRSLEESQMLRDDFVGTAHVLLGILRAKKGAAVNVLHALGVELERARAVVRRNPTGESKAGIALERVVAADPPHTAATAAVPVETTGATLRRETARSCAFCGRDLWDVAHYVNGDRGAICDECVADAQRVVAEATEDQHGLMLPPRVFGAVPDPGAPRMVENVFRTVFGTFATPAHRQRLIEDGSNIAPMLDAAQAQSGVRVEGVRLQRLRFPDQHRADVDFVLQLSTRRWLPSEGSAVRQGDSWVITRETIGRLVQMVGIELSAPND